LCFCSEKEEEEEDNKTDFHKNREGEVSAGPEELKATVSIYNVKCKRTQIYI
jgi:hypothetical protein